MTSEDIRRSLPKPEIAKLMQVAAGLKVDRVMGSRVLVEPVVPRTELDRVEQAGLIAIPEHVKKENTPRPSTGIVLQVGPQVPTEGPSALAPGQMVMFGKYSGMDFNIDQKNYRILDMAEIACTLEAVDGDLSAVVKPEGEQVPDVPVRAGEAKFS